MYKQKLTRKEINDLSLIDAIKVLNNKKIKFKLNTPDSEIRKIARSILRGKHAQ